MTSRADWLGFAEFIIHQLYFICKHYQVPKMYRPLETGNNRPVHSGA